MVFFSCFFIVSSPQRITIRQVRFSEWFRVILFGRVVVDAHFTPCRIKCASLVILFGMGGRLVTGASYSSSTLVGKVIPDVKPVAECSSSLARQQLRWVGQTVRSSPPLFRWPCFFPRRPCYQTGYTVRLTLYAQPVFQVLCWGYQPSR